MRNCHWASRILLAAIAAGALAQQEPLRFDVVSVVIDHAGTGGGGDKFPKHGTWHWTRIPLPFLIMYAYNVSLREIEGIPNLFKGQDNAFDITAKMPPETTDAQFRLMLQSLLADRFKFAMHREMRESNVTTIEIAKGGAKLKPASGNCTRAEQSAELGPGEHRCGEIKLTFQLQDEASRQQYTGWSVSLADLAAELSPNGPVVDETGIKGLWDIDVTIQTPILPSTTDLAEQASREYEYNRNFNAAFEKQLGLTIDRSKSKKRPVPMIVVDHVELPTAN
jgi:uncharacterized protein (TIGR03435 family)